MAEPALFEQIYLQGVQIIDSFQMKEILTNAVFGMHIVAAQGYLMQAGEREGAGCVGAICAYCLRISISFKAEGETTISISLMNGLKIISSSGTSSPLDTKAV